MNQTKKLFYLTSIFFIIIWETKHIERTNENRSELFK